MELAQKYFPLAADYVKGDPDPFGYDNGVFPTNGRFEFSSIMMYGSLSRLLETREEVLANFHIPLLGKLPDGD